MKVDLLYQERALRLARLRARAAELVEAMSRYPQDEPPIRTVVEVGGKSEVVYNPAAVRKYGQWLLAASDDDLIKHADGDPDEHFELVVFGLSTIH